MFWSPKLELCIFNSFVFLNRKSPNADIVRRCAHYQAVWVSVREFIHFSILHRFLSSGIVLYEQCAGLKYLRNRKHVPCFYRVIETRVEVWENEKCCGNTSRRRVFPQLFRVLPNFHECFYNSIETRSTCFLFLLENTATKNILRPKLKILKISSQS